MSAFAEKITLPALQKHFVNIFLVFAREFCIENRQGFLVNFFWSPFPTKRSTKTPRKIRGKFGAEFGAKFGTKIRKIRGTCDSGELLEICIESYLKAPESLFWEPKGPFMSQKGHFP